MTDLEKCRSLGWLKANPCLDSVFSQKSKDFSISNLLAQLDRARITEKLYQLECHGISHAVGREAFHRKGDIGLSLRECDNTCGQGCMHGVMEGAFFKENLDGKLKHMTPKQLREKVKTFCAQVEKPGKSLDDVFKCYHGLGHAILYVYQELPQSLTACNVIEPGYARDSCMTGVFMENSSGFNTDKNSFIKDNDYLFPCSEVEDAYKASCYSMHVPNMFRRGLSVKQVVEECKKAKQYASICIGSLGMEMSTRVTTGDFKTASDVCIDLAGEYKGNCILHLTGSVVTSGDFGRKKMYEFCRSLTQVQHKKYCLNGIFQVARGHLDIPADMLYNECLAEKFDVTTCQEARMQARIKRS